MSQTGDGHFSPIGAFDESSDSVLVLDVARFKYSPHWLPLGALVKAMRAPDSVTGLPRGWLGVRAAQAPRSVLFTLEGAGPAVAAARVFGEETLRGLLGSCSSGDDASLLVARAAAAAPLAAVAAFVGLRAPSAAAAAETAAAAAVLAAAAAGERGPAKATGAGKEKAAAHACGSESADAADEANVCAIPDAAAALLAELEAWPALRLVREALDSAHPNKAFGAADADAKGTLDKNDNDGNGCSARSSAAASVAGRPDVVHAAAVASREEKDLESYGLLPERLALLLAASASASASPAGSDSSSSSSSSSPPWPAAARKLLTPPQGSVLAAEVSYLRAQWRELPALDAASAASAKAAGKGCGCGA